MSKFVPLPGGKPKVWKYRNDDLEELLGISRRKMKRLENENVLDRGDLKSLFRYMMSKKCGACEWR